MGRMVGPALGAVLALAACSDDGNAGGDGGCDPGEELDCTCEGGGLGRTVCLDGVFAPCECPLEPFVREFVTSSLRLPATLGEVRSLGFDLDGNGTIDNALGSLAMLSGAGAGAGDAVASGQLIQLHVLEGQGGDDARWSIYPGEPTPDPDFSGRGLFTVAEGPSGTLEGRFGDHTFRGGPAAVPLSLPFGDGSVPFALERVALQATVTAAGCDGKLGGAVPIGDFEGQFVPAVTMALNALIAADPGCQEDPPNPSPAVAAILAALDADGDLAITAEELLANPLFTAMARPDVDLDGDGETDAFGIGLGFTCVNAVFEHP